MELISRQAAIDALVKETVYPTRERIKRVAERKTSDEWITGINDALGVIEDLDAVPAEPREDAVSRKAVQYLLAHFVDEDKYVDACDGLKHLPPAQPEIIQCKDCKHRDYWGSCKKLNSIFNGHKTVTFDKNFFCGFAERKEE